jgi:mRNA-degrading endonuclease RelE of RelBE toxin-antitoxin system
MLRPFGARFQRYRVIVSETAREALRGLPNHMRPEIWSTIDSLEDDPYPADAGDLVDRSDPYILRRGEWFIIYEVSDNDGSVIILDVNS